MTDLRSALAAWCASYVRAFEAYDADAIAAHWTYPSLTTQAGRSFAFKSDEHFSKNTSRLLGFYKAQDVRRVVRHIVDAQAINLDTARMTVSDEMLNSADEPLAEWQATYIMQRVDDAWKAVMAIADGEVEAWAARGTPLGG